MRGSRGRPTTRRLMALVAVAAALLCGVEARERPGWHLGLPGTGWRAGCCRADGWGRVSLEGGRESWPAFQVGAWEAKPPGLLRLGLFWQHGRVVAWAGRSGYVVW